MRLQRRLSFLLKAVSVFSFIFSFGIIQAEPPTKEGPRKPPVDSPKPTPPNPNPPADVPPAGPSAEDLAKARTLGEADAKPDGAREGKERGNQDGKREGFHDGQDQGYRDCYDSEKTKATDEGYSDGFHDGEAEGSPVGMERGFRDGEAKGELEGRDYGKDQADRDSNAAAEPEGRRAGNDEANSGDADARGYADGLISGDKAARDKAKRIDYDRGRKDFYAEAYASGVEIRDAFAQKQALSFNAKNRNQAHSGIEGLMAFGDKSPQSDGRYKNYRRQFKSQEELAAYKTSYDSGYQSGYRYEYDSEHREAYRRSNREGLEDGCRDAKRKDFQRFYDAGRDRGHAECYSTAYDRSYKDAKKLAYNRKFKEVSDDTYKAVYDDLYRGHYEDARRAAYGERTGQLYKSGVDRGHNEKLNEMYPIYAQEEYQLGRVDEAQDFNDRPVRLIGAQATESIPNALFEPGEPLRFKFNLRNFSTAEVDGRDIALSAQALDERGVVVSEPASTLVRSLKSKSITDVSEALEFVLTESRVNQVSRIVVSASYRGRDVGTASINLTARYLVGIDFLERPKLSEGMRSTIKVRITNQSPIVSTDAVGVELLSNSKAIELVRSEGSVDAIPVGGSRIVEFIAIARTPDAVARIPLALMATSKSARRIGALDFSGDVPILNDYRIRVESDIKSLRTSGITRVAYRIQNISSRLLFKGLQLKINVIGAEEENAFEVLGRNPQYLTPLDNGDSLTFIFPILSKKPNSGAIIELEVQEDGRTTVIHRAEFKQGE